MNTLFVTRTEILQFEQSPIGQKYARITEEKFKQMQGHTSFKETTTGIKVTHTMTCCLTIPDDDLLRDANFEL